MAYKKKLTPQQALQKIQHYCVYQERSHREVRNKLFTYGLWPGEVEDLLSQLITDDFLNEQRFATAFAGGKFRMKKWGRLKIKKELEARGLTSRCIQTALKEISGDDYLKTLTSLLEKKAESIEESNAFKKKEKLSRYAIAKGFEPELVWKLLKEIGAGS